jgi:hypothetical protein
VLGGERQTCVFCEQNQPSTFLILEGLNLPKIPVIPVTIAFVPNNDQTYVDIHYCFTCLYKIFPYSSWTVNGTMSFCRPPDVGPGCPILSYKLAFLSRHLEGHTVLSDCHRGL